MPIASRHNDPGGPAEQILKHCDQPKEWLYVI